MLGMFVCVMLIVVLLFVGGGVGGLVGVVVNVEMYEWMKGSKFMDVG